jgi:copper(I)-binding protein
MLMGLKAPLKAGERVPLLLRFQRSGEVQVELEVRPLGAAHDMPGMHGH